MFSTRQMCQYHIAHNVCGSNHQIKNTQKPPLKLKHLLPTDYEDMGKYELIDQLKKAIEQLNIIENKCQSLMEKPKNINHKNIINKELPEYNVYMQSERSSYALVSDGQGFKYKPKKLLLIK